MKNPDPIDLIKSVLTMAVFVFIIVITMLSVAKPQFAQRDLATLDHISKVDDSRPAPRR